MRKLFVCIASLLTAHIAANAQLKYAPADNDDDPYEIKSYFMFGFDYLSNNVYLGRRDSVVLPYYSPYIGYHFGFGLYAKAMLSYTTTEGTHLDLTTLELGYDHNFSDHFTGGLNADRFIYNKNSVSVRANTVASAGVYGQYTNNIIEPQVEFDLNFNKRSTDEVLALMLDHDFSLVNGTLHILPTAGMNSGTERFLEEYYEQRNNNDQPAKKKIISNENQFLPLDYELSPKATYRITKWLFTLTPTYAIPVNPATVTYPATKTQPERAVEQKLSNSFYVELDICHR